MTTEYKWRMTPDDKWRAIWAGFTAGIVVTEVIALRPPRGDYAPASTFLRWVFHARHPSRFRRVAGRTAYLAMTVWLADHLFRGGVGDVLGDGRGHGG